MRHIKAVNRKARRIEQLMTANGDVYAMYQGPQGGA